MTYTETISIRHVDFTDRSMQTRRCCNQRISGVNQRNGLLPAKKILAGFPQCLAGFWRVIFHWRQITFK